mgnify:CR=1 FL=1
MSRQLEILMVEDNPGDVWLAFEALQLGHEPCKLYAVRDGNQALAFLRREGQYVHAPCPHLILLDLSLPRRSGHEVLAEIRAMEEFADMPIVILTTSAAESDIRRAYELQANDYLTKPTDLELLFDTVRSIKQWARLPNE